MRYPFCKHCVRFHLIESIRLPCHIESYAAATSAAAGANNAAAGAAANGAAGNATANTGAGFSEVALAAQQAGGLTAANQPTTDNSLGLDIELVSHH